MTERQKILSVFLGILVLGGIILIIGLPFRTVKGDVDFNIHDSNNNFHYEIGEVLEFTVNEPERVKGKSILWQMGNGDSISNKMVAKYAYPKSGKYLVTLKVDGHTVANRYIQVVSGIEAAAIDSVPRIHAVSEGYQGEELTFSADGVGVDTWMWEFGETGTVDAYEQQVTYTYETPGNYVVRLQTNTTKYPIEHRIKILPKFEKVEETITEPPVDSLGLAQDDIRRRLQIIANLSVRDNRAYKEQVNHIRDTYFCTPSSQVVVVVNGDKYNDFSGYCQGLHFLESSPKRRIKIQEVKIDNQNCVRTIQVTQSVADK